MDYFKPNNFNFSYPTLKKQKMKKILFAILMILSSSLYGQETIGRYKMDYASKEFTVDATQPEDGNYKLYISMMSLDPSVKVVGVSIENTEIPKLKSLLEEVKEKYQEWNQLATANNISDLDKEIPTTVRPDLSGFFRYGDWKFDFSVILRPRYLKKVDKQLVLLHTGKMVAFDNQYTDVSDAVFVFSDSKEIDQLIALLDPQKVTNFFSKKTNTEELFK
jgi:hypothetical protein